MTEEEGAIVESPDERLERLIEEEKVIMSVLKQTKLKYEELRLEQNELQFLYDRLMEICREESAENRIDEVPEVKLVCANQVIPEGQSLPTQDSVLDFDEIVNSNISTNLIHDGDLDEMIDEFTAGPASD